MLRLTFAFLIAAAVAGCEDLPLVGITHVAFRVSDLARARDFYGRVLGLGQPFEFTDNGKTTVAFMKVNDTQYVELYPGLPPAEDVRFSHVCLETTDIQKVRQHLEGAGLKPTPVTKARAGNLLCAVRDPEGQMIEFLQYLPGSMHSKARGKALAKERLSKRLMHAGVIARDLERSKAFYQGILGFREVWRGGPKDGDVRWINLRIPGARQDYIELMISPAAPTRGQLGSMQHICLESPDIEQSWKTVQTRGIPDKERYRPRVGRNKRRQLNLFDPDGSRIELMELNPIAQ